MQIDRVGATPRPAEPIPQPLLLHLAGGSVVGFLGWAALTVLRNRRVRGARAATVSPAIAE